MMKCETGEMGDGQKNVSTPGQVVGVRGGEGVGPARQSGTSRGGQQSWIFLITPSSSVYTQPSPRNTEENNLLCSPGTGSSFSEGIIKNM